MKMPIASAAAATGAVILAALVSGCTSPSRPVDSPPAAEPQIPPRLGVLRLEYTCPPDLPEQDILPDYSGAGFDHYFQSSAILYFIDTERKPPIECLPRKAYDEEYLFGESEASATRRRPRRRVEDWPAAEPQIPPRLGELRMDYPRPAVPATWTLLPEVDYWCPLNRFGGCPDFLAYSEPGIDETPFDDPRISHRYCHLYMCDGNWWFQEVSTPEDSKSELLSSAACSDWVVVDLRLRLNWVRQVAPVIQ